MPHSLEAVAASADYKRSLLASCGPPAQGSAVVRKNLQSIKKVVQVLNLGNRAKSAHGQTYALTGDGRLSNSRIRDANAAEFRLNAFKALVDVAYVPDVFAKNHELWIPGKKLLKIVAQNHPTVDQGGLGSKFCRNLFNGERSAAVKHA